MLSSKQSEKKKTNIKIEERLNEQSEHVTQHLNWTQLTHPMIIHVKNVQTVNLRFTQMSVQIQVIVHVPMMHDKNLKQVISNISMELVFMH